MENISGNRLKKGLSKIKKDINSKIGAVWKLKKKDVISKIKSLNYKYDEKTKELRTDSMIRKPRRIQL
tara:strand:+ start:3238 stop:3441 length:204 start_codon:yes stop_codon:yes gene_type:complete